MGQIIIVGDWEMRFLTIQVLIHVVAENCSHDNRWLWIEYESIRTRCLYPYNLGFEGACTYLARQTK
jgi:hypothetical protein